MTVENPEDRQIALFHMIVQLHDEVWKLKSELEPNPKIDMLLKRLEGTIYEGLIPEGDSEKDTIRDEHGNIIVTEEDCQ